MDKPVVLGGLTTTDLLRAWARGETGALARLLRRSYGGLRSSAAHVAKRNPNGLGPTELVHEMCLRLLRRAPTKAWSRGEFWGFTRRMLNDVSVQQRRGDAAAKRGGGLRPATLEQGRTAAPDTSIPTVRLAEALDRLRDAHPRRAKVVELRYFMGLSLVETAAALQIDRATVSREWKEARAWIRESLS